MAVMPWRESEKSDALSLGMAAVTLPYGSRKRHRSYFTLVASIATPVEAGELNLVQNRSAKAFLPEEADPSVTVLGN